MLSSRSLEFDDLIIGNLEYIQTTEAKINGGEMHKLCIYLGLYLGLGISCV